MADCLHWVPIDTGWRQGEQCFTWDEADYKVKWDSAMQLCKEVADSRPDFQGLASGLATQTLRQLKLDGQSYDVGDICVRCGEACIIVLLGARAAEKREVALPASALEAPPCVKHHGLLPAPKKQAHSSNPHFRRCGVGYCTNTGESVFRPLPGLKESVYRAEFLAVVRALEECNPKRLVSDCKGVVSCLHALRAGRRQAKGRHRDLESRALAALPAGVQIAWMKAHQSDRDADEGSVERADLQVGPKLRVRPEQWPRVRLPAPEPEPAAVETERPAVFPAEPFVCGPHQRVVAHETYAICVDCQQHVGVHTGRGRLNYHALKGRPCEPPKRKSVPS
eukprot:5268159-Amphidinium_carterae.2